MGKTLEEQGEREPAVSLPRTPPRHAGSFLSGASALRHRESNMVSELLSSIALHL